MLSLLWVSVFAEREIEYKELKVATFDWSLLYYAGAESFRVPRQTEEEQGTLSQITDVFRSYYSKAVDAASGYLEKIKGLKIEEKAK